MVAYLLAWGWSKMPSTPCNCGWTAEQPRLATKSLPLSFCMAKCEAANLLSFRITQKNRTLRDWTIPEPSRQGSCWVNLSSGLPCQWSKPKYLIGFPGGKRSKRRLWNSFAYFSFISGFVQADCNQCAAFDHGLASTPTKITIQRPPLWHIK